MRKVTQLACAAFEARRPFRRGNTHTDGTTLYLFGHAIAQHRDNGLYITHAGWPTRTTCERLNGLRGVGVRKKDGVLYCNGITFNDWHRVV